MVSVQFIMTISLLICVSFSKDLEGSNALVKNEVRLGQGPRIMEGILINYKNFAEALEACFNFANTDERSFQEFRDKLNGYASEYLGSIQPDFKKSLTVIREFYDTVENLYPNDQTFFEDILNIQHDIEEVVNTAKKLKERHKPISMIADNLKIHVKHLKLRLEEAIEFRKVKSKSNNLLLTLLDKKEEYLNHKNRMYTLLWWFGYYLLEYGACEVEMTMDQKDDIRHLQRIFQEESVALNRSIYVIDYLEPALTGYLNGIDELVSYLFMILREIKEIPNGSDQLKAVQTLRTAIVTEARSMNHATIRFESSMSIIQKTFEVMITENGKASHIHIWNETYYKDRTTTQNKLEKHCERLWFSYLILAILVTAILIVVLFCFYVVRGIFRFFKCFCCCSGCKRRDMNQPIKDKIQ